MTYQQWIEKVRELCGDTFNYLNDWYSFRVAYEQGMSPTKAVRDCKRWMEA